MDRDEVIKGFEVCSDVNGNCYDCPYMANGGDPEQCNRQAFKDALALLKEQETQLVLNIGQQISCSSGVCPKCGKMLNTTCNKRYCGDCGQAVKWE